MMRRASLALLGLVMGCGQLPALPDEAAERLPTELAFNGLSLAVGFEGAGETVQPNAILAGTAVEAMFTVRAQDGLPLAGALIQFGVKTERWERVLDFPLGTSCTTDAQGECSTVLRSEGRAGAVQFEARVAGLDSQWINLTVVPEAEQAQVLVEIEGLGSFDWQTGQGLDPLENDATRLVLDKNQTAGRTLSVRLLDTFGNALDGVPVELEVLRPGAPASGGADAGPSLDVGASAPDGSVAPDASPGDSGARADLGGALDAGSERDAGDAGAVRDVGDGDGGLNKPLSLTPDESPALLAAAGAEGCAGELLRGTEATANAAADGYTRFCVFPGELLGDFVVTIKPGALFLVDEKDRMSLRGETRAGAPSRVVYVDRGQTPEGEVPRLGCRPGSLSAVATFRTENDEGPVPNVRVRLEAEGGLDGLTSALEVSDAEGLVQVQAICPAQSLAGGRILADLAAVANDPAAAVAVQVRTDTVDELTVVEHGTWPTTLRSGGAPLTLRIQALDAAGAPVVRAGLRPDDDAPDPREPLRLVVSIASQGHAGRILVEDGNGALTVPLVEQTLVVDQDLGAADFRFKVQSPATFDNPIVLRFIEPGSQVSAQRVLHVAPGAPTHISVSPSGVVSAELLGAAGSFAFSVWDGEPGQGANRVPDVPISVSVPRSFVFLRGSNLTTITGRTGNDGRFVVDVLQAQPIGDHALEGSIRVGEAEVQAPVTVRVGAGEVASALEVRLAGEALPMVTPEGGEALPTLTLRGGTSLAQTLTFRVVNRFGGGMPGLGLNYTLEEGDEASCARFDEPGATDARGEVTYGPGHQTLTAGGEVTDCVYRFAHGNTAAVQRLRVRQVPGLPQRATLTLTLREGENDVAAVRLRNSMDPPNEWSDETSREVVLQAFDANNLPPAGLRMWLTVDNCYLQARAAELDEQGRAVFRVAGGADAEAPCVLGARYFNERNDYTPPALSLQGSGFVAPQLSEVHFDGSSSSFKLTRPFSTEYTWRLEGTGIRGPAGWLNGQCPQEGQCTYGQIVEMSPTWNEQGERSVLRVLTDEIPLTTTIQNGERRYTVRVRQSMMGPGRWLGFRIKDPGGEQQGQQLESVSRAVEFVAIPPVDWVSNSPGGTPSRVTINGQGVSIRGGHRLNLDADQADEFVLCGHAAGGRNFFAVVDRSEQGALPEAVDAVLSVEGQGDAQTHPQNACRVADLDGDGRLDLVLPGPKRLPDAQAGFLGFTVHRGVQDGFFESEGQHLVWQIPALVNQDSVHFVLKTGPASIVACVASNCAAPKELFINWNAQTERFAAGAMAAHPAMPGAHQRSEQSVNVDDYNVGEGGTARRVGAQATRIVRGIQNRSVYARSQDQRFVLLAEGSPREQMFVVRVSDHVIVRTLTWNAPRFSLHYGTFNSAGTRVAAIAMEGRVVVWDLEEGAQGDTLQPSLELMSAGVGNGLSVQFSPDDTMLAAAGHGFTPRIWNAVTGDIVCDLPGRHTRISWHPDSSKIVAVYPNRGREVLDGQQIEVQPSISGYELVDGQPQAVFGHVIAGSGVISRVYRVGERPRWKLLFNTGRQEEFDWEGELESQPASLGYTGGWDDSAGGLQVYSGNGGLRLVLGGTRSEVINVPGNRPVTNAVFALDGQRIFYSYNGDTYERDVATYRHGDYLPSVSLGSVLEGLTIIPGHSQPARDLAFYNGSSFYLRRPITWRASCGNGVVEPGEAFDNGQPGEVSEFAYTCGAVCGDGVVQSGEDCDDGNDVDGDGCLTTCQPHRCGDGIAALGLDRDHPSFEACDDANSDSIDGCDVMCRRCGDGHLDPLEGCDDGNDIAGDGCTNCTLTMCGNGQVDEGEVCDDGSSECIRCVVHEQASPRISAYTLSPDQESGANTLLTDGMGPESPNAPAVQWQRLLPVTITLELAELSLWQSVDVYSLQGLYGWVFPGVAIESSDDGIHWNEHESLRTIHTLQEFDRGVQNPERFSRMEARLEAPTVSRYVRLTFDCRVREHCPYFRTSEVAVRR